MTGSSSINQNGDYDDVYMYYSGDEEISVGGSTEFVGSVYALTSDFTITGSGGVKGHIITGGDNVDVTGAATANVRAIYAPNALLNVTGSGSISGATVSKSIEVIGNARIYYNNSMNMNFFNQLEWNTGGSNDEEPVLIPNKNWWGTGTWKSI